MPPSDDGVPTEPSCYRIGPMMRSLPALPLIRVSLGLALGTGGCSPLQQEVPEGTEGSTSTGGSSGMNTADPGTSSGAVTNASGEADTTGSDDATAGTTSSDTTSSDTTSSDTTEGGCLPGEQDNDGDGECQPACAPDECGEHGTCDDSTGATVCLCDAPFSGAACEQCAPAVLLDDPFEDGDITTGGPGSVNAGFIYSDNTDDNGTLEELGGLARVMTPTPGSGTQPNIGGHSSGTFDGTLPGGVTAVLEVAAADVPRFNGIAVALNSNPGFYVNTGRPSVSLHVRETNVRVEARIDGSGTEVFDTVNYDVEELGDGFTMVFSASPSGWSYVLDGLMLDGSLISNEGTWTAGFEYADLLDDTSHACFGIQGHNSDMEPRVLDVERITVLDGVCDPGQIPTLP